jgi:DNA-directed RNA polymerase subunit M/transcription elongation factor TFIIS
LEFDHNHPLRSQKCQRCGSLLKPQIGCCGSIFYFNCDNCGNLMALTDKTVTAMIAEYEKTKAANART